MRKMSIITPEASFIFVYIALLYNAGLSLKLIYNSLSNPLYERKVWNLSSAGLIFVGTILFFLWFNFSLSVDFVWGGLVGCFLLFVNNLLATIFAFKNLIEVSRWGKANYIFFTVLSLQSFMLLLNFIEAQTIFGLPRVLEWLMIIPSVGYSAFQAFLYGPVGYFFPALLLIPLAAPIKFMRSPEPEPEPEKTTTKKTKKQGKDSKESVFTEEIEIPEQKKPAVWKTILSFLDNGSKGIFAILFILLMVFSLLNIGTFTSFSDFKGSDYQPTYPERTDFEFSVSLKTITYQQTLLVNYEAIFQEELALIKELNVSTVRIDVKAEIVDNNLTELIDITDQLHANGFKIMLSTYGYGFPTWNYQAVNFTDYVDVIEQQAKTLILNCTPEYLLIYPEPLGFSSAFVRELQTPVVWASTINDSVNYLRSFTNDTEIGVNLSFNDFDKYAFETSVFEELWENTTLDFMGIDFYIIHARDLNLDVYLEDVTSNTKEFWVCEFGVSAVMYGERIQEAALARLLEICVKESRIKGFNYFSLIDDLAGGNSLGLVGQTGHQRLSFYKYQEIINKVVL